MVYAYVSYKHKVKKVYILSVGRYKVFEFLLLFRPLLVYNTNFQIIFTKKLKKDQIVCI